jgi:hypothetical protein
MIILINLGVICCACLLWFTLIKTGFYQNGFIARKYLCCLCILFLFSSCLEQSDERSISSREALIHWHYGLKFSDYNRFNKIIFGERVEQVKLALEIYQPSHNYDIVWLRDSLVGKKLDTVFVIYRTIDTEWGDIPFSKRFVLVNNEWKTTLKDR